MFSLLILLSSPQECDSWLLNLLYFYFVNRRIVMNHHHTQKCWSLNQFPLYASINGGYSCISCHILIIENMQIHSHLERFLNAHYLNCLIDPYNIKILQSRPMVTSFPTWRIQLIFLKLEEYEEFLYSCYKLKEENY